MTTLAPPRTLRLLHPGLLLVGFATAVTIRVVVGGPGVAQSAPAGLVFGVCLLVLTLAAGTRPPLTRRAAGLGLIGALVLCLPVLIEHGRRPLQSAHGFALWALVVSFVAIAEELFLRGALYDAVERASGPPAAVAVGAVAFALLHVPLYGWHVVPLDLAVGVLLGELRRTARTPAAPAITHVVADLAAWFLR